ncbi:hypothetical protein NN561_004095 [Cricetulus griseus]
MACPAAPCIKEAAPAASGPVPSALAAAGTARTRRRSPSQRPCAPPSADRPGHRTSLQQRARPPSLLRLFPSPRPHPAGYLGFFGAPSQESRS